MNEMFKHNLKINRNPIDWLKKNIPEIYFELNCRYDLLKFHSIIINYDLGLGEDYMSIDLYYKKDMLKSIQVINSSHDRLGFYGDEQTVKKAIKEKSFKASINSLLNIPTSPATFNVYKVDYYTEQESIAHYFLRTYNYN